MNLMNIGSNKLKNELLLEFYSFTVHDQKPDDLLVLGGWNPGGEASGIPQQVTI